MFTPSRTLQLSSIASSRASARARQLLLHTSTPLYTIPTSRASQATFGAQGNLGIAPKEMAQIPTIKLNDGNSIPVLGYGLGTAHYKSDPNSALDKSLIKTVVTAIKAGFHHLDGAQVYGNESELGHAIKESGVPRSQLYVTTKITGTENPPTLSAFNDSLKKLQLDYVDLYLIHAPFFASTPSELQAKWRDLEEIHRSGKAKSIGVSNFLQKDLEAILEIASIKPAVNQIEYHPYLQHGTLLDFHKKHSIITVAFAPLTAVTKAKPGPLDEIYKDLAHKHGVTEGEVAIRWVIDQGAVAITTSGNKDRLEAYINKIPKFKLTPAEVERIREVGKEKHFRGFWKHKFAEDDRS